MESVFIVYEFIFEGGNDPYEDGLDSEKIGALLYDAQMPYREEIARFDTIDEARDFARTLHPSSVRKMYGGQCKGTEFTVYSIEEVIPDGEDIADVVDGWDFYAEDLMSLRDQEDMTVEWIREMEYDARHGDEYAMMALSEYWDQFDEVPDDDDDPEPETDTEFDLERLKAYYNWYIVAFEMLDDTDQDIHAVGGYPKCKLF